jgi:hypothetical protein
MIPMTLFTVVYSFVDAKPTIKDANGFEIMHISLSFLINIGTILGNLVYNVIGIMMCLPYDKNSTFENINNLGLKTIHN